MPIKKSDEYTKEVTARRLFARMNENVVGLNTLIGDLLTTSNALRLALGAATLSLAEIEALHVNMTHEKRSHDALLEQAHERLSDMLDQAANKLTDVVSVASAQLPKVENLSAQALRVTEKDIVDPEPAGPVESMQYVDAAFIAKQLDCTAQYVGQMVKRGLFPANDAAGEGELSKPKNLWLKHKALVAIHQYQNRNTKKGIAALV